MRKRKPERPTAPPQQRDNIGTDKSALREKLWRELSSATYDATSLGLPRAAVIKTMLEIAEGICQVAEQNGDDLTELRGLLSC